MKNGIYTIRDNKLNSSIQVFPAANNLTAMRQFQDIVLAGNNPISKHPEDYTLHRIGTWDDDNDNLENLDNETLANALEYTNEPDS